eukprot:Selendium_serpulae@DN6234_c0_g1_i2.p2
MNKLVPLYPLYVDATWHLVWQTLAGCYGPQRDVNAERETKVIWTRWRGTSTKSSDAPNVTVSISARTCLDLFLQTKPFPVGAEVLMSGLNIPDVSLILRRHGYQPVPIDMNIETLEVDIGAAKASVSERTKCFLVAHLYGARVALDETVRFCQANNLMLIEDCAETFCGKSYTGDPRADLSFFSFGLIKTNTSFGGAVAFVKDAARHSKMEELQDQYETQSLLGYIKRVLIACLIICIQSRIAVQMMGRMHMATGWDYKQALVPLLRGFSRGYDLTRFRFKPCGALSRCMAIRFNSWNQDTFDQDMNKLLVFSKDLKAKGIEVPGLRAKSRNFWLYPVRCPSSTSPSQFCHELWKLGVEASTQSTQLEIVQPPVTGAYQSTELPCMKI